jgi:hypothetical protein
VTAEPAADVERVFASRMQHARAIEQPLVLISQIQRSGGTLLNTLLDGHPQVYSHPHELQIGHPTKYDWPELDLGEDSDEWLEALTEPPISQLFREGYKKAPRAINQRIDVLPFTIVPSLIEQLFRLLCDEDPPGSSREILNRYFTAFFNAWIDNQGLWERPKRWITAFGPRLAWGQSRRRFQADYPDGRLIAVLRDPRGWYASARVHQRQYASLDAAAKLWNQSTDEMLAAKRENPDQVLIVAYEHLTLKPRRTMKAVARWLGIDWDQILEVPTFNRLPVPPNSSHEVLAPEIQADQAERWKDLLETETVREIEHRLLSSYRRAVPAVDV